MDQPQRQLREALEEQVALEQCRRVRVGIPHQCLGARLGGEVAPLRAAVREPVGPAVEHLDRVVTREPPLRAVAVQRSRGRGGELRAMGVEDLREREHRAVGRVHRAHDGLDADLLREPADRLEREAAMPAGRAVRLDPTLVGPPAQPTGTDPERLGGGVE
ncbi:hypothetical protein OJ998_18890 [Solirubrobacter taibaiensis]|nr:hypothetical protein [Solirubrobacter taibaiensis]